MTMINNALSERQEEVLGFILSFIREHNFPPTVREIARKFDFSASFAYEVICILKKKNKINYDPHTRRSISIVEYENKQTGDGFCHVPVKGYVSAGQKVLNTDAIGGSIKVHSAMLKNAKNYFALKVKGDGMTGAGIFDGDIIIVEKKDSAKLGEIVVVELGDGLALKKYSRQSSRIKLLSENPKYPPVFLSEAHIMGRIAMLYRVY